MASERTPQQIIGDDAYTQLIFEGYVVTRPAPAATDTGLVTVGYAHRGTIGLLMEGTVDAAAIVPKPGGDFETPVVMREKADELLAEKDVIIRSHLTTIASLEAKLAAANRALEPFARHAKERAVDAPEWRDADTVKIVVTISELRTVSALGE